MNYEVIGSLFLTNESIEIKENGLKSIYKVNELNKIQLKENFFQNYTRMRDIIHDGIGSILIDNGKIESAKERYLKRKQANS